MIKYFPYLKRLQEIGEKTTQFADVFGEIDERIVTDIEGLKLKKLAYSKANAGYIVCKKELELLNPPAEISNEHKQIINGYQAMTDGVDILHSSIDLDEREINGNKYQLGMESLISAVKTVEKATNDIVNKLK